MTVNFSLTFVVFHIGVGVALLADVTFQTTWSNTVDQFSSFTAGLSPLNSTLVQIYNLPVFYWVYFPAIFTDGRTVFPIPPHSCSGTDCFSYFFPGGIGAVSPYPSVALEDTTYPDASGFVLHDTAGFQIEFYPLSSNDSLSLTDCQIYGWSGAAIQICIKQDGGDLIAGTILICRISNSQGIMYVPFLLAMSTPV